MQTERASMEKEAVENLWNGNTETQIQAAVELRNFSRKQRHNLAESGVIVPLISMLHSQNYEAIEAALCALLSLAFGSERNKSRIIKSGALPVLLSLIHCQSQTVVELTIATLLTISSCNSNKVPIASSGAIQVLAQFLNSNINSSTQSQLDTLATLHNLSTCQEIITSFIVSSGVIHSLIELIQRSEKSSTMVEKAIGLLEHIVSSSKSALCEAASIRGAVRTLVETIEDGSFQSQEHAVGTLLLFCKSCRDKFRGMILREGVMPGLLQLSVDGTWRAKNLAKKLLLLLRDCSNYSSTSKQINHEVVERIMEEIDDAEGEELAETTLRLVEEMVAKLST